MTMRHFPPPWSVEDIGVAYVVKDGGRACEALLLVDDE